MELGVNLAVEPFSIGLSREGVSLASLTLSSSAYDFSENVMANVDQLCNSIGETYDDITSIGVVNGPGSYTGLRLSVAQCKTMASIMNIPLFGIDTFDVILDQVPKLPSLIAVIIPARKKEVNVKLARTVDGPEWLTDDYISVKYDKLAQFFADLSEPIVLAGVLDGLSSFSGDHTLLSVSVSGTAVSARAFQNFSEDKKGDYLKVLPKYSHQAI
jgi:tRNA threonylcarbamoyl adenosine modification protein YeaZ